ncbi:MAG: transglycosylase SLT domain-containing protein [Gammaproteobacteria bacterium]|nr:transglycosylase SLT domain-containing protein [Gammaproteobacteria bacterium]
MTQSRHIASLSGLLLFGLLLAGPALPAASEAESPSSPGTGNQPAPATMQVDGIEVPTLGNTADTDLVLSREVPDTLVFETSAESVSPEQTTSALSADLSVWEQIRASEPIPFTSTEEIKLQRQQYLTDAWWVNKTLARATPFLHFITTKLNERKLPLDLALIPAVESGYQPYASSSLSALGLWQIVPITAREIGMKRTTWFDERGDLELATRAALDYLSYLNAEFNGDWLLTLAAYNAGPGRVKSAIRKNRAAKKATDFWSLKLPPETRAYVPKVLALSELIRQQPESPLKLVDIPPSLPFTTVDTETRISLDKAALLAGVKESEIRNLNAGLIHAVTAPQGPHRIRLPIDAVERFRVNLKKAKHPSSLYSLPRIHVVKAGESISTIAREYGISQRQLKNLNNLDGSKILIGQKLAVRDSRHEAALGDGNTLSYTIRQGDTLSEIAERFNVKMADITFASGATARDRVLIPGQKLTIQVREDSSG